jgi:hypothetical protein
MPGQDAALGCDLFEGAGRIVQRHVLGDRRMETGVAVGGPLSAAVTIASARQVGVLVESPPQELRQVVAHEGIIDL